MENQLEDTLAKRFSSFWLGLFAFLMFAFAAVVAVPLMTSEKDGDPSLDGGALAVARKATLDEVSKAQLPLVSGYDWVDKDKGIVRVPVEAAYKAAAQQLSAGKPVKTESIVPNSPTAIKMLEEQAAAATAEAGDDSVAVLFKSLPNQMQYDVKEFEVPAGKEVVITIQNPDALQHNLIICKPGTKDKMGMAANLMAADPKAMEKHYVPESDDVLFATKLIDPNATAQLKFTAPTEPGDYPYLCTFPGHWVLMNGVMRVVAN